MCRAEIPSDYLDHPILLEKLSPHGNIEEPLTENQWYYEGRNGWWKYDERSNIELETAFNNRDPECTLLLAGALYSIDFQSMTQVKCSDRTRRRRVRRDTPLFPAKGVAGIKADEQQPMEQVKSDHDTNSNITSSEDNVIEVPEDGDDVEVIEITEPAIIVIDDVSDEFERLNIVNIQDSET